MRRSSVCAVLLSAVAGVFAACAAAPEPVAQERAPAVVEDPPPPATGRIEGRVVLRGERPEPVTFNVSSDAYFALQNPDGVPDPKFAVNDDGSVPHVGLAIVRPRSEVSSDPVPADPATMEIVRADFHPHVLAVREGQAVEIRNDGQT